MKKDRSVTKESLTNKFVDTRYMEGLWSKNDLSVSDVELGKRMMAHVKDLSSPQKEKELVRYVLSYCYRFESMKAA